ncbi:MAG TPA: MBL fold metallo-hydrolase [Geobacterales bacterium]|nr:MBL fold metallo-hydrolase [Geobacterales bacterium]
MKVVRLVAPPLENNVYIVYDEESKEGCVIDVAQASDEVFSFIRNKDLKIKFIVSTHAHADHTAHNKKIKAMLNNSILVMHEKDAILMKALFDLKYPYIHEPLEYQEPGRYLNEGDALNFGKYELKVIHTPGHTPGSICLYEEKEKVLFSGDTLFQGTYGRVDFPYSSEEEIIKSLKKLSKLPRETLVYPGHGPETRIGLEYWLFSL